MTSPSEPTPPPAASAGPDARETSRLRRGLMGLLMVLGAYFVISYLVLPTLWKGHEKRHPALIDADTVTHTKDGIPGDPLNIALVGSEEQVIRGMLAAKWFPADPITLKSSIRIAADVVLHRTYDDAPVSDLFLYGRKEDLAFELPIGDDPKKRHHVRFWKAPKLDADQRPLWMGAATRDERVGLSHDTGQVTHHISSDVDAERDLIIADLQKAGRLASVQWIDNFQKVPEGKNGGGDPWRTDGRLAVGVLAVGVQERRDEVTGGAGIESPRPKP